MSYKTVAMALAVAFAALAVTACSTPGRRGAATAEACALGGVSDANAAAAASDGGQKANQAPFAGETGMRADASATIGNGQGDTSASRDGNVETRSVSSGGAQNLGLYVPAESQATAGSGSGGGTALAIRSEFRKDMDAMRQDMMAIRQDPELTPEQKAVEIAAIREAMATARTDLALALSHAGSVTNNVDQSGDNTVVGYSKAGNGEGPDSPAAMKVLGDAARATLERKAASENAPAAADVPSTPSGSGGE